MQEANRWYAWGPEARLCVTILTLLFYNSIAVVNIQSENMAAAFEPRVANDAGEDRMRIVERWPEIPIHLQMFNERGALWIKAQEGHHGS